MPGFPSKTLAFPTQKTFYLINVFLIVFIFFAALLFTRDIISIVFSKKEFQRTGGEVSLRTGNKTTTTMIPKVKDIMGYAHILEKNPFGNPLKLVSIAAGHSDRSAGSLTNLVLVGTVVGPKNLTYAIFEDKSQSTPFKQEVFAYGKNVYDYGILTRIEKGWVELKRGTNIYTIPITDMRVTEIESKTQSTFIQKVGEKEYILNQRKVQEALNTPEQILTDARLLPNIRDSRQEGFTLSEVRPGGLYDSLGLRNGDVLLKINRLEISSPDVAMQAMSALKGMDMVNLDIIRNGEKMTMTYQIR